jgi:hypothetical protein
MERGDLTKGSQAFEEVNGPLAQRRRIEDWAFTGFGPVLNTSGLSTGRLLHIAARSGPSELVVKETEERALADAMAMNVEERANALIKQLEDADCHGVRMYSPSCFYFSFVLLSDRNRFFP